MCLLNKVADKKQFSLEVMSCDSGHDLTHSVILLSGFLKVFYILCILVPRVRPMYLIAARSWCKKKVLCWHIIVPVKPFLNVLKICGCCDWKCLAIGQPVIFSGRKAAWHCKNHSSQSNHGSLEPWYPHTRVTQETMDREPSGTEKIITVNISGKLQDRCTCLTWISQIIG